MKKVLLHICCGVCALHSIEKLKSDGFYVEGLFFNPNIYPADEFVKRSQIASKACELADVKFSLVQYDNDLWQRECANLGAESEGGRRCLICYRMRLGKTAEIALNNSFDYFTSTLTISPHKNSKEIFEIGKEVGKEIFLELDFKKEDGFKKTIARAKELQFYRQNYCGCEFSIHKA